MLDTVSEERMDECVYDRIKARVLVQTLLPGQLLQTSALADELNVSVTPVREALIRLATERLITFVPKRGFFTKMPSESEIRALYSVNMAMLYSVACKDRQRGVVRTRHSSEQCPSLKYRDPQHLALGVAELFLDMVLQSDIAEAADIVRNINDRLYQTRLMECKIIADVFEEVSSMRGLYESGEYEEVRQAIRFYHDKRVRLTGEICKELHFMPFSSKETP